MRRATLVLTGVIFSLMLFVTSAKAADKFGYVDLVKVLSEYNKTKDYDKALGDKENAYVSEREKKINEVKQLQDKINLLSDKEKEAKGKELESKIKSLRDFDTQKQTDLRKEQTDKMNEIVKDVDLVVKQYAEKEGYTIIFNEKALFYKASNMDITDKIVGLLNKGKK